jgi:hypothetical protein
MKKSLDQQLLENLAGQLTELWEDVEEAQVLGLLPDTSWKVGERANHPLIGHVTVDKVHGAKVQVKDKRGNLHHVTAHALKSVEFSEDWNKVNHHDKTNGLSQKAVDAYRREHPGSKLQTAVTTKPSKLKPGSKAAKRRKSFCARMSGNKGPMKKPNGKPTPKALALRRWNCESIEEMAQMIIEGTEMIAELKKGQKDSNGYTKCWPGKHAEGTKKGKNGGQVRNCVPNENMVSEKWSQKYKNSINCSNPKGFSQRAHCAGKKK